ncbi:MAG: thiamine pyrophosphate-binding protein, partial [Thermomicrobiales bacterium]
MALAADDDMFAGTGAQILVESLCRAGITTLFGVPGDTGIGFYDALHGARGRIQHVLARDERHAATMADVYARRTNTVGVAEASSGGGAMFLVSGLGEPFAASVPLLIITSDIHQRSHGTAAITEVDQAQLFAAVTKWRAVVEDAADVPRLVAEALDAATSGRPGPTALIFPENIFEERRTVAFPPATLGTPRERIPADAAAVRRAADSLRGAARPAIVAGGGVHLSSAWEALAELAESAGIPVATTIHGKGAFSDGSPWSLGVVGANGAREYANAYLADADVVLFVGTRANSTDTNGYTSPPRTTTVLHIDIDTGRAGHNYPSSLALIGDAATVLGQLTEALPPNQAGERIGLREWITVRRREWETQSRQPIALDAGLVHPRDVVRAVQNAAGSDTVVVGDAGTATPNLASYWEIATAGRTVLLPRGHGPMGWAIPGAIGASFAHPGRTVVAMTTEGSLAMACGELETAARFQLPVIFVQFTNGSFGWIKMLQHLYTEQRYFGVEPGPIDAPAVARGMGLRAMRVESLAAFERAFADCLAAGGPCYIEVPVPDQIALTPPV